MNKPRAQGPAGSPLAILASVVGLALVWSIVWANLPSWDELQSAQPRVPAVPAVPELDLTIPGVPSRPSSAPSRLDGEARRMSEATISKNTGELSGTHTMHAGQAVEMKCAAQVRDVCPDAMTQGERHQCLERRMRQLSAPCQAFVQKRVVRWKEAE